MGRGGGGPITTRLNITCNVHKYPFLTKICSFSWKIVDFVSSFRIHLHSRPINFVRFRYCFQFFCICFLTALMWGPITTEIKLTTKASKTDLLLALTHIPTHFHSQPSISVSIFTLLFALIQYDWCAKVEITKTIYHFRQITLAHDSVNWLLILYIRGTPGFKRSSIKYRRRHIFSDAHCNEKCFRTIRVFDLSTRNTRRIANRSSDMINLLWIWCKPSLLAFLVILFMCI